MGSLEEYVIEDGCFDPTKPEKPAVFVRFWMDMRLHLEERKISFELESRTPTVRGLIEVSVDEHGARPELLGTERCTSPSEFAKIVFNRILRPE